MLADGCFLGARSHGFSLVCAEGASELPGIPSSKDSNPVLNHCPGAPAPYTDTRGVKAPIYGI